MAISERLLEILVCPENKSSLHPADEGTVTAINSRISAGILVNRAGKSVTQEIEAGLIREDGRYLYPIREDIPVMLIDEAIPMEQVR